MIDIRNVKVGDQVTLCGEVLEKDERSARIKVVFLTPPRVWWWVSAEEIIEHKSRNLKVGNFVTWGSKDNNYEIVAIKEDLAILYHHVFSPQIKYLSDLTLVEIPNET